MAIWEFPGSVYTGLAVQPAAWSNDPFSCMSAPAGMGRIEFLETATSFKLSDENYSGAAVVVLPVGHTGFHTAAAMAWDNKSQRGTGQISGSYIVTGDPIGFMEGLFGPSITLGFSSRYIFADSIPEELGSFDIDAGFQFSLFPSFAIGMMYTDILNNREITTGFTNVFNRNLKGHVAFTDDSWQVGCELSVTRYLKVFSGTDTEHVHAGLLYSFGKWKSDYAVILHENAIEHSIGLSRRFQ